MNLFTFLTITLTGMNNEDFSTGGNEGYAYLVGWVAGCFVKVMKEYGKTK